MLLAAAWQRLLVAGVAVAALWAAVLWVAPSTPSTAPAQPSVRRGGCRRRPMQWPKSARCAPLSDPDRQRLAAAASIGSTSPSQADRRAGQCARSGRVLCYRAARARARRHLPRRGGARHQGRGVRRRRAGRRNARGILAPSIAGAERGGACGVRCADRRRARHRGNLPCRRRRVCR